MINSLLDLFAGSDNAIKIGWIISTAGLIVAGAGMIITSVYQIISIRKLSKNINASYTAQYMATWTELNKIIIEHPELIEVWLSSSELKKFKKFKNPYDRNSFYRRRTFAAALFDMYYQLYLLEGPEEINDIDFDMPALKELWKKELIHDYDDPPFVEIVNKRMFPESSISSKSKKTDKIRSQ